MLCTMCEDGFVGLWLFLVLWGEGEEYTPFVFTGPGALGNDGQLPSVDMCRIFLGVIFLKG